MPHMIKGVNKLLWTSFIRAVISFKRGLPNDFIISQSPHLFYFYVHFTPKSPRLLLSSLWGLRFQHRNLQGHKHSDYSNIFFFPFRATEEIITICESKCWSKCLNWISKCDQDFKKYIKLVFKNKNLIPCLLGLQHWEPYHNIWCYPNPNNWWLVAVEL